MLLHWLLVNIVGRYLDNLFCDCVLKEKNPRARVWVNISNPRFDKINRYTAVFRWKKERREKKHFFLFVTVHNICCAQLRLFLRYK